MKVIRFDLLWIAPAAFMVATELLVANLIGSAVGFHYDMAVWAYFVIATAIASISAFAVLLLILGSYPLRRIASPIKQLRNDAVTIAWTAFAVVSGIYLVVFQLCALNWTKSMLPHATGFWADPLLARLDHALFGNDPWIFLHQVFGQTRIFDFAYGLWGPLKFGTLLLFIALPGSRTKAIALLAYFLTMILGMLVGQFVLPSAGPIFYQLLGLGDRFAAMPLAPWSGMARDYLWDAYINNTGKVGGGISAFPSMHVAISVWIALTWGSVHRVLGFVGAVFATLVMIGSVYLGWHYAVDGLVSIIGVVLIWWASGRFVDWVEAREARLARADLDPSGAVGHAAVLVTPAGASPARRPA